MKFCPELFGERIVFLNIKSSDLNCFHACQIEFERVL